MREKFLSFSTDALLNEALLASIQGRNQLRPFGEVRTATAGDSDEGGSPPPHAKLLGANIHQQVLAPRIVAIEFNATAADCCGYRDGTAFSAVAPRERPACSTVRAPGQTYSSKLVRVAEHRALHRARAAAGTPVRKAEWSPVLLGCLPNGTWNRFSRLAFPMSEAVREP
jgi:hypothetical protein